MSPEEIAKCIKDQWGSHILASNIVGGHPQVTVAADQWPAVAIWLRDDPRLRLNGLRCISSLDLVADDKIACIYDLYHVPTNEPTKLKTTTQTFAVRVEVDRNQPVIPSVSHVWPAAEWHEREAYDLMGVTFSGHPDLRRILCADDWVGHPLRKDYEFPLEYHGIPATTEFELTNPRH